MIPSDALSLFVERASAVDASFRVDEHVAAICEAVDELPLAIELAAARVRSLSTAAIRERLTERLGLLITANRDADERQKTLEATIAWSYDLLDGEEQRALRVLSVFAGGCTLSAAQAVAGADLSLVESLLDKSLLRHRMDESGHDRYWMLETIREYAAGRLGVADETEEAETRHTGFFLAYAPDLMPPSGRATTNEQINRYKVDAANFRVALSRALADGDAATALRFVRCLGRLLFRLGPFVEAYSIARASLALTGGSDDDRAYSLVRAANFAALLGGETDAARAQLAEAEVLFSALDDGMGLAEVYACRSKLGEVVGDYDEAVGFAEKQAALARELGDADIARFARLKLADALSARAIEEDDRAAAEQSRAIYAALHRDLGTLDSEFERVAINDSFALVEFAVGNYSESIACCQRSLRGLLELGLERTPDPLLILGWTTAARGQTSLGVKLVAAAMRQYRQDGMDLERWGHVQMERFERSSRHVLGDGGYETALRAGEGLSNEEAARLALSVKAVD